MPPIQAVIFDVLYKLSRELPGGRISERTYEWVEGGGNSQRSVECYQVTVEAAWQGRPMLIHFFTYPKAPELPGAELFLSSRGMACDLWIRRRGFFDWLPRRGKLRPASPALQGAFTFLAQTPGTRAAAEQLLRHPELEAALAELPWEMLHRLELQEGCGVSARYRQHILHGLTREFVEAQAEALARLLLLCP